MDKKVILFIALFVLSTLFFYSTSTERPVEELFKKFEGAVSELTQPQEPQQPNISVVIPSFMEYPQLVEQLKAWEKEAEDLVEIGTYGKTTKNKDQVYIRITNEMKTGDKPKVLMSGCIHGNEPISTCTVLGWIGTILDNYGKDAKITELVDTRELWFIPVISPDSYPNSRSVDGVDPNRNFYDNKKSVTPIQNLRDFFKKQEFDAFASGHSYGRVFIYPSNKDAYKRICGKMGDLSGYRTRGGSAGPTLDANWADRQGAFGIIIEFGTHQRPPSDNEIKDEFNRTYEAALYFMKEAPIAFENNAKPDLHNTSEGLIEAGLQFPGANVCKSEPHPLLMELATKHAEYQARVRTQGHQNFNKRSQEIMNAGLGRETAEICAESWKRQENDSMFDLGWEMFKCWKESPGHWSVASKQHRYFGADMAKGSNGVWYSCIIVCN